jgi:hypothetical protein
VSIMDVIAAAAPNHVSDRNSRLGKLDEEKRDNYHRVADLHFVVNANCQFQKYHKMRFRMLLLKIICPL